MFFKSFLIFLSLLFYLSSLAAENIVLVEQAEDIHPSILKGKSKKFSSPVGSYQTLLKSRGKGGIKCLIYKVPLPNKPQSGVLFFIKGKNSCPLAEKEKREVLYEGIKRLEAFDIDWDKRFSFKLRLNYGDNKERVLTLFIPFPTAEKSYWPGVRPIRHREEKNRSLVEGDICHIGCSQEKSNCQSCPQGQWTAFLSLNCPGEVSGLCGAEKCGQRGQNACVRMTTYRQRVDCEGMKKYVYCSFGRELECQSNGDLTCR